MAARLRSQGLSGPPAATPEDVVRRLLAVQAQDGRGARLAVRSRSTGLTAADVDTGLTTRRSLLITWVNRGTLHLVVPEDYWWLHPLTTPQLVTGNIRRLRQEGVSPDQAERGVEIVAEAVTSGGPQTRGQLRVRLQAAGVPTAGQALIQVLLAASIRGLVVRGPVVGGESAYVAVPDWLGVAPKPLEREEALARLARRYLAGHGPASAPDLARWAGISLGDARRGMDGIGAELITHEGGLLQLADEAGPDDPGSGPAPPRLLGAFEPLLLGWVSRRPFVGPHQDVVTNNGIFRPVALVEGRAVATWGLAGGSVQLHPLEAILSQPLAALRRDAGEVLRFLGLPPRPAIVNG